MSNDNRLRRHPGLNVSFDPRDESRAKGGPGAQQQKWPGSESEMNPPADHGEDSYEGSGRLAGKVALITGGDSGIGRAVAIAFAREGADVAISYLNEHEDAKETAFWVEKAGRKALLIEGDLRDPEHCRSIVQRTVKELGGLNILVNNAAFHYDTAEFKDLTYEQIERTFHTNIFPTILVSQEAIKHMSGGDSIINVGSVVAMFGSPLLLDYAASKAAIHNITNSLATMLAPEGIRVNGVAPGPVWTPLIPSTRLEDVVKEFGADTVWGRPAQPAELASTFVFLASADSRFYTGEILSPSGKLTQVR